MCSIFDTRLAQSEYLAGEEYTVADIASYPDIHLYHDDGVATGDYPNGMVIIVDEADRLSIPLLEELRARAERGPPPRRGRPAGHGPRPGLEAGLQEWWGRENCRTIQKDYMMNTLKFFELSFHTHRIH